MAVLGHTKIDYCVYDGTDITTITVKRDDQYIEELIEKGKEFYDCLKNCKPPPSSEIHYEMVSSDSACASATRLYNAREKIKELDAIVEQEKKILAELANGRNIQISIPDSKGDVSMQITKQVRKGAIKYKSIPNLKNIDLEKYRGSSTEFYQFR